MSTVPYPLCIYNCLFVVTRITGHLGSGQFGSVEKAVWMKKGGKTMVVAVKALKPGASKEEKVKFLQEAAIMGQFKHPNVVCLCGMTPNKEKVGNLISILCNSVITNNMSR